MQPLDQHHAHTDQTCLCDPIAQKILTCDKVSYGSQAKVWNRGRNHQSSYQRGHFMLLPSLKLGMVWMQNIRVFTCSVVDCRVRSQVPAASRVTSPSLSGRKMSLEVSFRTSPLLVCYKRSNSTSSTSWLIDCFVFLFWYKMVQSLRRIKQNSVRNIIHSTFLRCFIRRNQTEPKLTSKKNQN